MFQAAKVFSSNPDPDSRLGNLKAIELDQLQLLLNRYKKLCDNRRLLSRLKDGGASARGTLAAVEAELERRRAGGDGPRAAHCRRAQVDRLSQRLQRMEWTSASQRSQKGSGEAVELESDDDPDPCTDNKSTGQLHTQTRWSPNPAAGGASPAGSGWLAGGPLPASDAATAPMASGAATAPSASDAATAPTAAGAATAPSASGAATAPSASVPITRQMLAKSSTAGRHPRFQTNRPRPLPPHSDPPPLEEPDIDMHAAPHDAQRTANGNGVAGGRSILSQWSDSALAPPVRPKATTQLLDMQESLLLLSSHERQLQAERMGRLMARTLHVTDPDGDSESTMSDADLSGHEDEHGDER